MAAVAGLLVYSATRVGLDGDSWWHLAAGRWMVEHHQLLRRDIFSYSAAGRPWMPIEWGYEVALGWGWDHVGSWWAVAMAAGPAWATVGLVVLRARRGPLSRTVGLCAAVAGVLLPVLDDRPQMLSYLLFAGCLWLVAAGARRPRRYLALTVLGLLWANVHGSFLLGAALVVGWAAWATLARRVGRPGPAPVPAWAGAAGFIAATFVNPWGPGLWLHALGELTDSRLTRFIQEWAPPDLHQANLVLLLAVPVGLAGWAAYRRLRLPWFETTVAVALWGASIHSVRFLPYATIAWVAVVAQRPGDRRARRTLPWGPAAVAVVVATLAVLPWAPPGAPAPGTPVAAVNWLTRHPGRVFADYAWGGYLIDRGIATFIDGRTDLYLGTPVFDQYAAVQSLAVAPDGLLRRYRVRYVLWTPGTRLARYLASDPAWVSAYRDRSAVVFARVTTTPARGDATR